MFCQPMHVKYHLCGDFDVAKTVAALLHGPVSTVHRSAQVDIIQPLVV